MYGQQTRADAVEIRKEIDDIAYEVDCAMIIVKDGEVDIGMLCFLKLFA